MKHLTLMHLSVAALLSLPVSSAAAAEPVLPLNPVELAKFWRETPSEIPEDLTLQKAFGVSDLAGVNPYTRLARVFLRSVADSDEVQQRAEIIVTDTGGASDALRPLAELIAGPAPLPTGWSRTRAVSLPGVQLPVRDGTVHLIFLLNMRYTIELKLDGIPVAEAGEWLDRFRHATLPSSGSLHPPQEGQALVVYLDELQPANNRWATRQAVSADEAEKSDRAFRSLVESQEEMAED